jgi:hypothetical protein
MVAGCIAPCWYLTVLGETRRLIKCLRTNHDTQSPQVIFARELGISGINYQGISYVARLSNKPLQQTGASYHMRLPSNIRRVVLSVHGIGLRRIQLVDHGSDLVADGSSWYEILEVDCPDLEARVNSDVRLSITSRYARANPARAFLSATFGLWKGRPLRVESGALLSHPNSTRGISSTLMPNPG